MCIEFWLILYIGNDMIEKLCPGLALYSISNQLLLLYSSKIIFPIRAALFCLFTNMEAWSLVSTSRVLCTAGCFLLHVELWGPHPSGHKTLIVTWHWRPHPCSACEVVGETWTLSSCTFRTCDFPSCLSSLLIPRVKGAARGGWAQRLWGPCLSLVSWGSSQPLHQPRLMCWRCFQVRGPCPAAPRDPPWLQILESVKGPLGFFTHMLSQPCWPGLLGLSIPRATGPGITATLRTHCCIQTVLPLLPNPGLPHPLSFSYTFPSLIPPNFPSLSANPAATTCLWRTLVTLFWLNEIGSVCLYPF